MLFQYGTNELKDQNGGCNTPRQMICQFDCGMNYGNSVPHKSYTSQQLLFCSQLSMGDGHPGLMGLALPPVDQGPWLKPGPAPTPVPPMVGATVLPIRQEIPRLTYPATLVHAQVRLHTPYVLCETKKLYFFHTVGDYATIPEGLSPPTFSAWTSTAANDGTKCFALCNQGCQENMKCLGEEIKSTAKNVTQDSIAYQLQKRHLFRWWYHNHLQMQQKFSRVRTFWYRRIVDAN